MANKIVIIGGGPAGYKAALYGASLGAEIYLIENHKIGGTCLNYGCIPTKTLIEHASFYHKTMNPEPFGVQVEASTLDYNKVLEHKASVIDTLGSGILAKLKKAKVTYLEGHGYITSPSSVRVTLTDGCVQEIDCSHIVLATGSKPFMPSFPGVHNERVLTSRTLLGLNTLPKSLSIVGGGVIGMEFAVLLQNFGVQVTVLEYAQNLLPLLDSALGKRLKSFVTKSGVQVITQAEVVGFESADSSVRVLYQDKKGEHSVQSDYALMAIGRIGNFDCQMLDEQSIHHSERFIRVNEHYETSVQNIYAIGDVNGQSLLAHSAYDQAHQLMDNLLNGMNVKVKPIPSCVFTSPEIASIGFSEEDAKKQSLNYTVQKTLYSNSGKALAMGEGSGFIKTLADENGLIIGCHILGAHSSDLIHYASIAMTAQMNISELKSIIFAHPTLGELFSDNMHQF